MADLHIRTTAGQETVLGEKTVEHLQSSVRGSVLLPGALGYDEARALWNSMIDRRPALIVRCTGAADVVQTVKLASEHGLLLSIKGGGHN